MLHAARVCMDTPATLADALSALDAASTRVTELSSEVVALNELLNESAAAVNERNLLKAQVEQLTQQHAELSQQLAATAANAKSVDEQAALIVASAGHPPVEVMPSEDVVARPKSLAEKLEGVEDSLERSRIRAEYLQSLK